MNSTCHFCKQSFVVVDLDRPRCTHCHRPNPAIATTLEGSIRLNLGVTQNEARTGNSLGPVQHYERAKIRARETGRNPNVPTNNKSSRT